MTPDDDPTWPVCTANDTMPCNHYVESKGWCEHVRKLFLDNLDASEIQTGMRICVPIYPVAGLFAQISIDTGTNPIMAPMALVKSLPFTNDEELIDLGFWTSGEGRMSMSTVIQDYVFTREGVTCQIVGHGPMQEVFIKNFTEMDKKINLWHLVIDEACLPCWRKMQQVRGASTNFGMNTVEPSNRSQGSPPPSSGSVMEKLGNRYGSAPGRNTTSVASTHASGTAMDFPVPGHRPNRLTN